MNLQTAVAASMLPTSRGAVAAAFKQLRHDSAAGAPFLEFLWAAAGRSDVLGQAPIERLLDAAARAIDEAPGRQIQPVSLLDDRYPALLACTIDPPPVLWVRGEIDLFRLPAVAVIGSRAATPYALQVGTRIAAELAARGVVVASGLARGVDSAAHRGALKERGKTIAVLGCGPDRVYPPEHADLAADIVGHGMLVAELAPGAPPLPEHFPLRNRIISGLSLATVVVEASEHSGSLITARCALEQGRDVMAVPGSVLSGRNRGSHALLKDGAKIVESAEDILQELGWDSRAVAADSSRSLHSEPILSQMAPGEPYGLDELSQMTGMDSARLLARLTELELAGHITAATGRFIRTA